MTSRLRALWLARTERERWLLGIMLALLALVAVWFLILRPLGDMLSAARERHGTAVAALVEARSQAAAIASLERGRPGGSAQPVDTEVAAAASDAGFQLAALQAEGADRASFAIGAARPQALFGWIAAMEQRGYVVERLNATSNPDRTLSAQILLRRRAG